MSSHFAGSNTYTPKKLDDYIAIIKNETERK